MLAMAAAARRMPSREADYRRFTLNQRIQVATPFVSPSLWESRHGQVAPLAELPVLYAGFDLSAVNDLSAFVMVGKKGGAWHSHCRFWLPKEGLAEKVAADHAPYDAWARQGHLLTTPDRTIDYDFVAHELRELFDRTRFNASPTTPGALAFSNLLCCAPDLPKARSPSAFRSSPKRPK